jgi:hypothetical protein
MEIQTPEFPTNSMLWTKHMFHVDEKFREWIMEEVKKICPNIEDLIKKDDSVNHEGRSAQQKNRAIMTVIWSQIRLKESSKAVIDNKYYEAKFAHKAESLVRKNEELCALTKEQTDKLQKLEHDHNELRSQVFMIIKMFSTSCNELNETIERQKVEIDKLLTRKN